MQHDFITTDHYYCYVCSRNYADTFSAIYGGLILLAGFVVGCTVLILEEIQSLKEKIDDLSNK